MANEEPMVKHFVRRTTNRLKVGDACTVGFLWEPLRIVTRIEDDEVHFDNGTTLPVSNTETVEVTELRTSRKDGW